MPGTREFAALFEAALDAVFVVDDGRVVISANPAAAVLLAEPLDEIVGRRFDDFVAHPESLETEWQAFVTTGRARGRLRLARPHAGAAEVEYTATANFVTGRHFAIVRDVTERVEAETERAAMYRRETARLRETETLLSVSRALCETLDPTETMRRVAREIAYTLGADMVGAYLADAAQEALWPVAGYHVPKQMLEDFQRFPIPIRNHPAIEEVWTQGHAVWTDDMAADERVHRESYARFPHQSNIFTPINIKGRPVGGFFAIWWRERRTFTPEERRLLQGIGDLAGIFLENAHLYRDMAQANRAKDEFIATLSHELRNPLGAIANAIAALDRCGPRVEIAARLREIIHRQTRHLARLVDDLLEVARVTAGKVTLDRYVVELADVVTRAVHALQAAGRGQQHAIRLDLESVFVDVDPVRLEQIVTNLVDNAIKYTAPTGTIHVEVRRDAAHAVLRVVDTGVGIAREMLPHVFELFTQGEQALDRALGGLGIGLALSRRLVEMHGGTIRAMSDGRDRGAQFIVRLPAVAPRPTPISTPPSRVAGARTILVVEDNDDSRESLRLLLESIGHQVLESAEGRTALTVALAERPDVILIDIGLPGLDGYALARAIRADERGRGMRLIAVTGYGQADDRHRAIEAGFDAHVVKPVSLGVLRSLLAS